jgi:hypothetical protein
MRLALTLAVVLASTGGAAERAWQTGTWIDLRVERQMIDFGPGSTPFDRGASAPPMRALADVRTYVIETDDLRLELKDVVRINKRSLEAVLGRPVTFALEKNTIYIRDDRGIEHKLRVTKRTRKKQSVSPPRGG